MERTKKGSGKEQLASVWLDQNNCKSATDDTTLIKNYFNIKLHTSLTLGQSSADRQFKFKKGNLSASNILMVPVSYDNTNVPPLLA